jgi:hypothetical protein
MPSVETNARQARAAISSGTVAIFGRTFSSTLKESMFSLSIVEIENEQPILSQE